MTGADALSTSAAVGAADRQGAAQTVTLGPRDATPPYRRWRVEVDADGRVVCPICGDRVPVEVAQHHTATVPAGALLPMSHGLERDDWRDD